MDDGLQLLDRLDKSISKGEGLQIIHGGKEILSDKLVSAILNRSNELQSSGDKDGAMEFQAWAEEARGLITLDRIFSTSPADEVAAERYLN